MPPCTKTLFKQLVASQHTVYPDILKTFALTLNFYSPKAYNYVRQTFQNILPHPRTLQRWCSTIECKPGFHTESMHTLKIKVKESQAKVKACVCALMLDEMAIHKKIEWDGENFVGSVLRIYFKYMYFYTLQNHNNYLSSIRFPIIHTGILHCRYLDIGTDEQSDNPVEAKEALVFLVNCVNDRWKLPVGYFLIDGLSGSRKAI